MGINYRRYKCRLISTSMTSRYASAILAGMHLWQGRRCCQTMLPNVLHQSHARNGRALPRAGTGFARLSSLAHAVTPQRQQCGGEGATRHYHRRHSQAYICWSIKNVLSCRCDQHRAATEA